jgi:tRNA(Ile)-lysidine synthase
MARRELGPASLAVVQAVEASLDATDRALLVGCSGGPDSLALAFGAIRVARRRDLAYAAVVVNHGLQAGSAGVAERARDQLTGMGYDDVAVAAAQVRESGGPEAAARQARYEVLDREALSRHATLLLGHTLDDQAETVLLGLARGSGSRSLAGMAPRVHRSALSPARVRPLLGLRRRTTEAACAELGLTPWVDPHNADQRFSRVRVRETVLPLLEDQLGPGVAEALARTAVLVRDDADLLDQVAAAAYAGTDTLDCAHLLSEPPAIRRRLLRLWLLGHGLTDLTFQHINSVDRLVTDWHGQAGVELPGARVTRSDGRLVVD